MSGDNFIEDFTCAVKRNLNNDKRRSLQSKMKMRAVRNDPFCRPPMCKLQVGKNGRKRRRGDKKLRLSVCLKFGPSFWLLKILMLSHLHPLRLCVSACVAQRSRSTWQIALGLVARPLPVEQLKYSVIAAFCYIHIIAI